MSGRALDNARDRQLRLGEATPAPSGVLQAAQQAKRARKGPDAPGRQGEGEAPCYSDARRRQGERLQKCREDSGLTQAQLADALGVKRSAISFLERGWVPFPDEFEAGCRLAAEGKVSERVGKSGDPGD